MQQREVEIVNKLGLDAPASAKLARLAAKYQCDVSLARGGRKVNAKSLMGVMMLAAGKGPIITTSENHQGLGNELIWQCRALYDELGSSAAGRLDRMFNFIAESGVTGGQSSKWTVRDP